MSIIKPMDKNDNTHVSITHLSGRSIYHQRKLTEVLYTSSVMPLAVFFICIARLYLRDDMMSCVHTYLHPII